MPGQIVDDSILGDNKERTKLYWESLMRHDQLERDRLHSGNNKRSSRTCSSTSPVMQKINMEIEELSRRERELSKGGVMGPHEEDDDVFSSTASSVDDFEHSESPRLESGFYSNVGEDEVGVCTESGDTKQNNVVAVKGTAVLVHKASSPSPRPAEVNERKDTGTQHATRPPSPPFNANGAVDEDSPKVFRFEKETPIEKEIRLASEREEEHRQRRLSSMVDPVTPKVPTAAADMKVAKSVKTGVEEKGFEGGPKGSSVRKMQYQMATERLRKEMVEAQRREEELHKVHRTVSMSTLATVKDLDEGPVEKVVVRKVEIEQWSPKPCSPVGKVKEPTMKVKGQPSTVKEVTNVDRPRTLSPINSTFEPSSPTAFGNLKSPSFTKAGFNSMQRFLLKSSVQLRIAKNFQVPPPTVQHPPQKEEPGSVEEPPRRKLVPATHKIQNELREMQEREKELALVRSRTFKSTPNLSLDLTLQPMNLDEHSPVSPVSRETFTPRERKRSNLITQWESIIHNAN